MWWYCRSTLIGHRVVVMFTRGPPVEGEGGGNRSARVAEGEGPGTQWYEPVCITSPPLVIAVGSNFLRR